METFSALLAICAGNSPVTGEFPAQRPVMWSFDVFFDLRLNKRQYKGKAGDLRCHHARYDVTVVIKDFEIQQTNLVLWDSPRAVRWMSLNPTDDKSTLVQVMACCRQATSHYLIQCWPRSMLPYGVTRPQWFVWFTLLISSKNGELMGYSE